MDASTLSWPFFTDEHRAFASSLQSWAEANARPHGSDIDVTCQHLVSAFGAAGWLRYAIPAPHGRAPARLDIRTLCIAREILARISPIADFAFAMQGLGAGPISLFGSEALKSRYLPRVANGDSIAAFALSEVDAGSDVSAMKTIARKDGPDYIIDGEKTWISNGGIADQYVVFCRLQEASSFVALVVEASDQGFNIEERLETISPHPLARISLTECRIPADRLVGVEGKGLNVALGTLDAFRPTVGAAALGMARRALDEALAHVTTRRIGGQSLDSFQLTQARIAAMATAIDASALLVYRAAWTRDTGADRITREAAMAKSFATESAQRVIDDAVQLLGGRGVERGSVVEKLYREIRALRIYEGTTEVQQLIIASQVVKAFKENAS